MEVGRRTRARTAPCCSRWRERNGPKVQRTGRKGFGHIVMERTLADSLQGKVKLDFAPDGLRWEAEIPADRFYILDRSAPAPAPETRSAVHAPDKTLELTLLLAKRVTFRSRVGFANGPIDP